LRNGVLDLFGPKLSALTVSAAYPYAFGRVSDHELTDADFWRGALEIRGDGGAGLIQSCALLRIVEAMPRPKRAHINHGPCSRLQRAGG
jgi:hypothetical protein